MARLDEEREWEGLKRMLAGLLVADTRGGNIVGVTVWDAAGRKVVVKPRVGRGYGGKEAEICLLSQFYSVKEIGAISDWEWVKAKKGQVGIEGWISTQGAPSKRYQFICTWHSHYSLTRY